MAEPPRGDEHIAQEREQDELLEYRAHLSRAKCGPERPKERASPSTPRSLRDLDIIAWRFQRLFPHGASYP